MDTSTPAVRDVLLSDGGSARVRPLRADDAEQVRALYERSSEGSRYLRFFSPVPVDAAVRLTRQPADDPRHCMLAAEVDGASSSVWASTTQPMRPESPRSRSWSRTSSRVVASVPRCSSRSSSGATARGIRRFRAAYLRPNRQMADVFAHAGFEIRWDHHDADVGGVDFELLPTDDWVDAHAHRDDVAQARSIARLLSPRSIAVIGAGSHADSIGRAIVDQPRRGRLHRGPSIRSTRTKRRSAATRRGRPCSTIPGPVDLAVVAVPADGGDRRRRAVRREGRPRDRRDLGRVRRAARRYRRPAGAHRSVPADGHAARRPELRRRREHPSRRPHERDVLAGAARSRVVSGSRRSRVASASSCSPARTRSDSASRPSCRWATRPTSRATTCCSTGTPTPTRTSCCSTSSRWATRASSRGWPEQLARRKPIVALKSGRTTAGARGTRSHTAALADPDAAVDALLRQSGVIRVDTLEELFDVASLLAHQPVPAGRRVAVMSNGGGPAIVAADACVAAGLEVPELSTDLQSRPARARADRRRRRTRSTSSPSAGAPVFERAAGLLLESGEIDALLVIYVAPYVTSADDVAAAVASASARRRATSRSLACFLGLEDPPASLDVPGSDRVVPTFTYPESGGCGRCRTPHGSASGVTQPEGTCRAVRRSTANGRVPGSPTRWTHAPDDGLWAPADVTFGLLADFGIPVVRSEHARSAAEAAATRQRPRLPRRAEAAPPELVHKTDVGGVRLGPHQRARRPRGLRRDASRSRTCGWAARSCNRWHHRASSSSSASTTIRPSDRSSSSAWAASPPSSDATPCSRSHRSPTPTSTACCDRCGDRRCSSVTAARHPSTSMALADLLGRIGLPRGGDRRDRRARLQPGDRLPQWCARRRRQAAPHAPRPHPRESLHPRLNGA